MKKIILFLGIFFPFFAFGQSSFSIEGAPANNKRIILPNGWGLTPAGRSLQLGDLPLNIALSRDGKYIAVTNNGVGEQTLQLIDATNETPLCTMPIPKSWLGLKFSDNGKYLYASGGNDNRILVYSVQQDSLIRHR